MKPVSSENSRALVDHQVRPRGPGTHDPHSYLPGVALKAKGDLDGAIAEGGAAIRQRPNYPEVQSAHGRALEAKGKSGPRTPRAAERGYAKLQPFLRRNLVERLDAD